MLLNLTENEKAEVYNEIKNFLLDITGMYINPNHNLLNNNSLFQEIYHFHNKNGEPLNLFMTVQEKEEGNELSKSLNYYYCPQNWYVPENQENQFVEYKSIYPIIDEKTLNSINEILDRKKYIEFLRILYDFNSYDKHIDNLYSSDDDFSILTENVNESLNINIEIKYKNTKDYIEFYKDTIKIDIVEEESEKVNQTIYMNQENSLLKDLSQDKKESLYNFIEYKEYKDDDTHNFIYMLKIIQSIYFSSNYTIPPKQTQNCRGHSGGFRRKSRRSKSRRKSKSRKSKARKSRKTKKSRKSQKIS